MTPTSQVVGKFVPNYYVTDALTLLFLRGASISNPIILLNFTVVLATSITTLLVVILPFRKYGKT